MNSKLGQFSCTTGCWLIAAVVGILAAILLMLIGDWSFLKSLFAGAVIFVLGGLLLNFFMCRSLPALGEKQVDTPDIQAPAAPTVADPAPSARASTSAVASSAASTSATASTSGDAAAASKPVMTSSKALAGQDELASRKGSWKYEGEAKDAASSAAPIAAATPKADTIEKVTTKADDKPAVVAAKPATKADDKPAAASQPATEAPAGPGKKPETLSSARDGGPDDLKQIKGVGPKMEGLLHSMGFYHFDQVGSWGADEVAWVDQNLEGFKGRVTRDQWVSQAKTLAEGGVTEFSSKVKKGGVY